MLHPIRLCLFFGLLLLLISSCNNLRQTSSSTRDRSADFLIQHLAQNQIDAQWLDARARIAYSDEHMSVRGSALIRWQRDKVLWMSMRKLGFEVARVKITPDSVYVIDRINNQYGIYDLQYLSESYQLPADFQLLQTIMLGEAWLSPLIQPEVETTPESYFLLQRQPQREVRYRLHSGTLQLQEMALVEPTAERSVTLTLGEYQEVSKKQLFSYLRNLAVISPETGAIQMDVQFSDVTFNQPKSTQFEIPERYTRMD